MKHDNPTLQIRIPRWLNLAPGICIGVILAVGLTTFANVPGGTTVEPVMMVSNLAETVPSTAKTSSTWSLRALD